ncbi:MAG: selenide, water dikinase SelD [Burkholderiaceae bacterium]
MQSSEQPVLRDIVLVGGGHSHVGVLRNFAMRPMPGVRLTLLCTEVHTPYSGMLPGYVAGHYAFDEVHIDLSRLAVFAGARFICAEVTGLDRAARKVVLRDRPAIGYDRLSINIGSTPQTAQVPGATGHVVPVKPIAQFDQRWLALLDRVRRHPGRTTIAVVGGGAGGVELLLAMQHRLGKELGSLQRDPGELSFHLFSADAAILPTHNHYVRERFMAVLAERGVSVHLGAAVERVEAGRLRSADGQWLDADEIVWVTQAGGAQWLRSTGLALDERGFVRVNSHLQSVNDPLVFAAGDIASFPERPLEKAGVFAVRMARPLADNLRRSVGDQSLTRYRPQRRWLAIISTGDQYAVASRGPLGFSGAWVWRWKDWIDRRFMRRFSDFPAMPQAVGTSDAALSEPCLPLTPDESLQALSAMAMRCGGCAAKVDATVLSRALGALRPVQRHDVLIGLHAPDDAAIVRVPPGKAVVHTVDYFRAFIDDPYLFGKVAANHALGDIFAMGAEPQSATAVATVPPGLESKVEELLLHMMAGAVEVLNAAGCALVGGHTGEGRELALGFAINGLIEADLGGVLRKSGMQPGDVLLLTKPIGTGTLFAAHARLAARGRWVQEALASMQVSNQQAAIILRDCGATACTDLTGFGLLGHLEEMTRPSGVDAEVDLATLPLLDGALECVASGIVSSLQAANLRLRRALANQGTFTADPRYPLLFDPQTAGGLLASVPADQAQACLRRLRVAGYARAATIGRVLPMGDALAPITLVG